MDDPVLSACDRLFVSVVTLSSFDTDAAEGAVCFRCCDVEADAPWLLFFLVASCVTLPDRMP